MTIYPFSFEFYNVGEVRYNWTAIARSTAETYRKLEIWLCACFVVKPADLLTSLCDLQRTARNSS